jgi:hypothetical protein
MQFRGGRGRERERERGALYGYCHKSYSSGLAYTEVNSLNILWNKQRVFKELVMLYDGFAM